MTLKNKNIYEAFGVLQAWNQNNLNLQKTQGLRFSVAQESYFSNLVKNLQTLIEPILQSRQTLIEKHHGTQDMQTGNIKFESVEQTQAFLAEWNELMELQVEINQALYPAQWNETLPAVSGFTEAIVSIFCKQ